VIARVSRVLFVEAVVLSAALLVSGPAVARSSGTTLSGSATAAGHLTSTYQWTVQKSASPATQIVAVGNSATVGYAITTTKSSSGVLDGWLDGQICVTNTGGVDTQGLAISDQLTDPPSRSAISTVAVVVSAKPVLAAGASWCYPFRISVPSASRVAGATYKDSAMVTITNASGHVGLATGPTPSVTAALPGSPTVVDDSITVNDSNGKTFSFTSSGTVNYSQSFDCATASGAQTMVENNTATIASTGQSSSAAATIHCGAPTTVSTILSKGTIGEGDDASDQATITGAAPTAGGTVEYYVYSDDTCTTQIADATPGDDTVVNGVAPASSPVVFIDAGTYFWVAVYSGDPSSNTLGSSSGCAAEPIAVQPNDFSISADPSSMTVLQGDSAMSTISTAVVSGSPGTIDLSVSGVPSGATASFDPASITGRGTSTLTIDTGTAAPGTYTLTVTGSDGDVAHSTQLTVSVVVGDFSISAEPASLTVFQGGAGSIAIATETTLGSAQTVALTVSGVPSGATASVAPTSLTTGQSSALSIDAGTAAPGTYTLTVTATAASGSHTTAITLTVAAQAHDFAISVSPSAMSIAQGAAGSSAISTETTSGSAQTVALTVSGVPSGATASFTPTSLTTGQSSTLNITAGTAALGTYTLTVTGTAASGSYMTTLSLTITPGEGPCTTESQLLGNPGFETGSASPWVMTSGVLNNSSTEPAHSGSWDAWLDGYGSSHTDWLSQTVTIPPDPCSAVLSFWLHIDTAETTTTSQFDTLQVQILNSSGTVLATLATYSNLNARTGYSQESLDVLSYKGQTITVRFIGTEDTSLQTSFVIDDTGLYVTS
jgi:uncharacterized membrane protein